jgi:ABC-type bacteriocin/lantibiotic exporter with double-glycine peptidase domain
MMAHWRLSAIVRLWLVSSFFLASVFPSYSEGNGGSKNPEKSSDRESVMCGPFSLSLAMKLIGIDCSIYVLAGDLKLSPAGISMAELGQLANAKGVQAVPYKLSSTQDLLQLTSQTPAIVLLRKNHFVTVWSAGGDQLWLAEYPKKARRIHHAQLVQEQWNPRVLVISRPNAKSPFPEKRNFGFPIFASLTCITGIYLLAKCIPRRKTQQLSSNH